MKQILGIVLKLVQGSITKHYYAARTRDTPVV